MKTTRAPYLLDIIVAHNNNTRSHAYERLDVCLFCILLSLPLPLFFFRYLHFICHLLVIDRPIDLSLCVCVLYIKAFILIPLFTLFTLFLLIFFRLFLSNRITNDSQANQVQAPPSHVQPYSNDSQSAIDQNNASMRSIKVNGKTSFLTGNGSIGINNVSGNGNINSDKIYLTNNVDRKNVATHQQQAPPLPPQSQQQPPPQPHIGSIKSLYEELTKTVPYQNRGTDFITYLLNGSKANTKAQAVALLNSLIENGYLLPMNTNAMDENSDGDRLVDFNENYIYRLLKTNDGISNSNSSFALNLDVDNNSSYLNRQDPNMMGKWHTLMHTHTLRAFIASTDQFH